MTPPLPKDGDRSSGGGGGGGTRGLSSRLPRSMRGYDCEATDALLAQLAARHAELERECVRLWDRTAALEAELAGHRQREEVLNRSLLAASNQAMTIREEARREAELILRKARAELARREERAKNVEAERAQAEQQLLHLRASTREVQQGLASVLAETLEQLRGWAETMAEGGGGPTVVRDQLAMLGALDAALKREGREPVSSFEDVGVSVDSDA